MADTRTRILECALALLRAGNTVTLESASHEAGLTKPGLMYYFPNKQALMLGLVAYVADRWASALDQLLGMPVADATPADRIRAYLEFALTGDFDETDMVMFSDPRLRESLAARWSSQMEEWIVLPGDLSADERSRLTAVRLLADGIWFAGATKTFPPDPSDLDRIRALAHKLIGDTPL